MGRCRFIVGFTFSLFLTFFFYFFRGGEPWSWVRCCCCCASAAPAPVTLCCMISKYMFKSSQNSIPFVCICFLGGRNAFFTWHITCSFLLFWCWALDATMLRKQKGPFHPPVSTQSILLCVLTGNYSRVSVSFSRFLTVSF